MDVSKKELQRLYENEEIPVSEVMRLLGIGNNATLYRLLREAGIPLRNTPPITLVE